MSEQLAQNRLRGRERRRGAKHLLQGLLACSCCGYAYYGKPVSRSSAKGKTPYVYYRCVGTDAYRFGGQRVCQNPQVRAERIEQAVWDDACELLRNPRLLRQEYERRLAAPESSETERSLRKQQTAAQSTLQRLIDIHTDGLIDRKEFEPRLTRARQRLAEVESKLESLASQSREQTALREALACVDSFSKTVSANLSQADWSTRREILRTVIDKVVIEPTQIRIIYRINFPLFAKSQNASKGKVLHFCWRSERAALRRPFWPLDTDAVLHHPRLQEAANDLQQTLVADSPGQSAHQDVVVHPVERHPMLMPPSTTRAMLAPRTMRRAADG